MKHTTRILLLAVTLLISGCFQSRHSLVRSCFPTDKLLSKAPVEYANHTAVTAQDLRHWLLDDTVHYKVLIMYSYCCGPCHEAMPTVYAPLYHSLDTSRCRMYFVLEDCGSLPWNDDYCKQYDIDTRYYMRDSDSLFLFWEKGKSNNQQDWTNIANYILQPQRAFTNCNYAPLSLIVAPDGRVKQQYVQFNDYSYLAAYDLRDMVLRDSVTVYDLDFDQIDTVSYNFDYRPDEGVVVDTTTFRNYHPRPKVCTPDGRCF